MFGLKLAGARFKNCVSYEKSKLRAAYISGFGFAEADLRKSLIPHPFHPNALSYNAQNPKNPVRDQGVGGSNPLSPTNDFRSGPETWVTERT